MAHFPDLSPYVYDGQHSSETGDLNVGWLELGQPYPTSTPSPEFVSALVRCCRRPARIYRGFHTCDLCENADAEMPFILHRGRKVHLGHGEVRVIGSDGRWYTAPTLVAHYVAQHHYAPSEAFVAGVANAASSIPELDTETFERIRGLAIPDRFDLCVAWLERNSREHPWLAGTVPRLRAVRPALDASQRAEYLVQLDELHDALLVSQQASEPPVTGLYDAALQTMQFFTYVRFPPDVAGERTLELSAELLEQGLEFGVDTADIVRGFTSR